MPLREQVGNSGGIVENDATSGRAFIPVSAPSLGERERAYVNEALASGWISSAGPWVERFERAFADFCGTREAVAVANGTVALHLALHAHGIGPGDEVVVPALTFAATAHAVLQVGATPVFVDVEPDTWCLDPYAVARALSPSTRAILPVHLFGHPADMAALMELARPRAIEVIEDAAQAHGAQVGERRVGGLGHAGTFSFYGNKLITTGEGGAIVTDDVALASRMRSLKDHGMSKERRYFHSELAFNYRMTNVQAALGCAQLERASALLAKKRAIAGWYRELLAGDPRLTLAVERRGYTNAYWMSSVVLADEVGASRDQIAQRLRARGIDSRPFFVPMPELPHLSRYRAVSARGSGCPTAARLGARGLSLPSGCDLERHQVARVAHALLEALDG
jgi:perosamine synthetase